MEEEFITNQERLKPQKEKAEEEGSKVDDLRGSPMSVGNLEELIDENHAIVLSSVGSECYMRIMSFVDKDQLEHGCVILTQNKLKKSLGKVRISSPDFCQIRPLQQPFDRLNPLTRHIRMLTR